MSIRLATTTVLIAATASVPALAATATRPTLAVTAKQPLSVVGAHFKARERVRLTAAASRSTATTTAVTTRRGTFRATFRGFDGDTCVTLVVTATGSRGDHARLVLEPPPGTGIPCRV
jgi:hypothetical protein